MLLLLPSTSIADLPDISDLSLDELLQLQEMVNNEIAIQIGQSQDEDDIGKTKFSEDGASITLVGCKESEGNSIWKPDSGNIFILVEFIIENNTKEEIAVSAILDFYAFYDGFACDNSFKAGTVVDHSMNGYIPVGRKMRGQVAWEITKDWEKLEVHYKPVLWGDERVVFIIHNNHKPIED